MTTEVIKVACKFTLLFLAILSWFITNTKTFGCIILWDYRPWLDNWEQDRQTHWLTRWIDTTNWQTDPTHRRTHARAHFDSWEEENPATPLSFMDPWRWMKKEKEGKKQEEEPYKRGKGEGEEKERKKGGETPLPCSLTSSFACFYFCKQANVLLNLTPNEHKAKEVSWSLAILLHILAST